jgi:hypothetical protein
MNHDSFIRVQSRDTKITAVGITLDSHASSDYFIKIIILLLFSLSRCLTAMAKEITIMNQLAIHSFYNFSEETLPYHYPNDLSITIEKDPLMSLW